MLKSKLKQALIIPILTFTVIWVVKLIELQHHLDFYKWGIYPRNFSTIYTVITAPFIHSDLNHVINNTFPLFILSTCIFFFYREIAVKIHLLIWFITNIWVWSAARESYHIGASGVLYGLASFLFFSGVFRKDYRLFSISLLVVFLYGSMIWGIFPIDYKISWESHLFGGLAGLVIAFWYRKEGPQRKFYDWENDDNDVENEDYFTVIDSHEKPIEKSKPVSINYIYKKDQN